MLVEHVEDFASLEALQITQTTSAHGSGGMRSKVVAADMATAAGIETVICNGAREGVLAAGARGGARGDAFAAREQRYSSFKLWLSTPGRRAAGRRSTPARRGRSAKTGRACCRSAIVEMRGSFEAGDAVEVVERGEELSARGSATTRPPTCGASPACTRRAVREMLPRATEEAVHRDYFVLA